MCTLTHIDIYMHIHTYINNTACIGQNQGYTLQSAYMGYMHKLPNVSELYLEYYCNNTLCLLNY